MTKTFRVSPCVTDKYEGIFDMLPAEYYDAYKDLTSSERASLTEIRLRSGLPSSFTVNGKSIPVKKGDRTIKTTVEELSSVVEKLCNGSVYAFAECISKGYINNTLCRVGIAGSAASSCENSADITHITSVNIRIPRFINGNVSEAVEHIYIKGIDNSMGLLAVSPPNCGKTTFLRSLAKELSDINGRFRLVTSIADERCEIYNQAFFGDCLCDALCGISKRLCADIAVRTMSAKLLVFDEITSEDDAEALLFAAKSGTYIAASVHASSFEEACEKNYIRKLVSQGVFKTVYVLDRNEDGFSGRLEAVG